MGTIKTNATTPQGARAARINRQTQLDSTSVSASGFCNTGGEECYASAKRGSGVNEAYPMWWLLSRLFVLSVVLVALKVFKK